MMAAGYPPNLSQREAWMNLTYEKELEEYNKDVCEEVVIEIEKEVQSLVVKPYRWSERCIYRVPKKLRKVKEDAYTPKLISIGPLHYHNPELWDMKLQKLRYFNDFCNRTNGCQKKDLARIIEDNEVKIRHCYEETSKLRRKEYVRMILLDAIFIIELFLRISEKNENNNTPANNEEEFDYILTTLWVDNNIKHDLILLENQLPLFILEELFKFANIRDNTSFLKLACEYFELEYSQIFGLENNISFLKHFTDLKRHSLCYYQKSHLQRKENHGFEPLIYSATKLDEAGVKFKKFTDKEDSSRRFLYIDFDKNTCLERCPWLNCSWILNCLPCFKMFPCLVNMQPFLKICPIEVYDESESLYRNVMAFEQCHYPSEAFVCDYFVLLDYLINTDKDVDFLVDKEIIVNGIGSNDGLAKLINELGHEITTPDPIYSELYCILNRHCKGSWNKIMASLTNVYFRDFWRGTATVVGLIVLGITLYNFIMDLFH